MKIYTPAEASEELGISVRAVQKRSKKEKIPRKSNHYQISEIVLERWRSEIKKKRTVNEPVRELTNQLEQSSQELNERSQEVKELREQLEVKEDLSNRLHRLLGHKETELKNLSSKIKELTKVNSEKEAIISDLRAELEQYNVSDNERIEVFTNEDYQVFEQRLREWYSLQKDIEHQEQIFNVEKKSLSELLEHYQKQFEYQKEQSTRILEMHQKLIDTIDKQSAISIQRNIIEASEKEIIKKDWKTK